MQPDQAEEKIQQELSDRVLPLIDSVIQERRGHWEKNASSAQGRKAVPGLISSYANHCAVIAGGLNLVPGPWGLIAVVPEIAGILQQQLGMIYDIGRAYGQEPTRELLLGVLLSGTGTGTGGLVVVQGSQVVVKRASMELLQRLVRALGGNVSQAMLRSMLARFVPVAGAAAMALWARHSTRKLGARAQEIFSKSVEFHEEELHEGDAVLPTAGSLVDCPNLQFERLKLLVSLMWIDRKADDREKAFVHSLMEAIGLSAHFRDSLEKSIETGVVPPINYKVFLEQPGDRVLVVMDLIALSRQDETIHPAECAFIREVGRELGLAPSDVEEMMEVELRD